ncbi:MAG: CBS domain-containing protein [Geobacter sp.]|nr:CBS domain-containing protein [Geobacter sp.]
MPDNVLHEDSFFFMPVDAICHRPAITCSPAAGLVEMARQLTAHNISGIVAVENDRPVGVVSLRDLRDLIAASVDDIKSMKVADIMKTSLITIRCNDYLFKAIFLMAKHNIHRLIVLDADDKLSGVLTDTDLLRIQTRSPLYLVQEIESAATVDQLRTIGQKMIGMLQYAVKTNADAQSLIQLIAHFNDAFTQRLILILEMLEGVYLPAGAAYLALGSEGRQEQTLRTDQDSAIVYRDDLPPEDLVAVRRFAERIAAALDSVGVPLCPGNMMASNPEWCHSIAEWKQLTEQWITQPGPDATVCFGVFQDLRVLHGDSSFERELRDHICVTARKFSLFFPGMARNIVRFKPPLGMFGRFKVEKAGEQRGKLDLKKGGLFALSRGVSLVALEAGIMGGTTWEKLEKLHHLHLISDHDLETISEAFTFLMRMRLVKQLIAIASGKKPGDFVDPLVLREGERDQLRAAFSGVESLLHILKSRYQLEMMAR